MATKGCHWLLPLPCSPGEYRPAECLRTAFAAIVVAPFTPAQPTTRFVESGRPRFPAMDSSPSRFASLSHRPLSRHSSKVGAVCVEAPVRFCAGGDQRWSSLPRHVSCELLLLFALLRTKLERHVGFYLHVYRFTTDRGGFVLPLLYRCDCRWRE